MECQTPEKLNILIIIYPKQDNNDNKKYRISFITQQVPLEKLSPAH